ncbi:MerR family transcriptional regulator [Tateyamaria sp. syn59]|uniref:MerR family transcriptional regulator n=1 Tax=Tateyamaria sp. syn59 TaxID=2576942 RepID=UPI0011BFD3EB|nr:MerR family transcriptional regulator [Tateyamaria sp. syn59]
MTKSADAFRTISEVAEWLGVQTHVLRFWESKFTQVKPVKRAGGRRYYRPADMLLLGGIRKLLHEDGLTIKGVQKILREEGMAHVADMSPPLDAETDAQLDADLTARMDEDVEQPPVEAEVVSFMPPPNAKTDAPVAEATPPEPEPASTEPEDMSPEPEITRPDPASAGDMAPLPSFLRTPAPPAGEADMDTDEQQGLPYPPFVEDVPAASTETPVEYADDPAPVLAEEDVSEPVEFAPTDTPPEPVDTHIEDQAEPPTPLDDSESKAPNAELPLEPTLDFGADAEGTADEAAEPVVEEEAAEVSLEPSMELDEPAADAPVADADEPAKPARTGLPSFLADYAAPADEVAPDPEPEEAAPPRPRVVDVPDDPAPETIAVAPSALTKASRATHLTDGQRTMIKPLLDQLIALRDQMADTRHTPR